jgi:hypothetical protein
LIKKLEIDRTNIIIRNNLDIKKIDSELKPLVNVEIR